MANKRITDVDYIDSLNSDESFFINHNNTIKQINKRNVVFDIVNGGTGADNLEDAKKNLGIGDVAAEDILPIEKGGTGAVTALLARENLGVEGNLFNKYTVNGINIDDTDGNWTVDITEEGYGTIPETDVNVTQHSGDKIKIQYAVKCDIKSQKATNRNQRMWMRDRAISSKQESYPWSEWVEFVTPKNSFVKLWENDYPSDAFEGRTIELFTEDEIANLSEDDYIYDFYLITFRAMTSGNGNRIISIIAPINEYSEIQWIENLYIDLNLKFHGRQIMVWASGTSVDFGNCYSVSPFGEVIERIEGSDRLIPQAIYGLHKNTNIIL